MADSLARRPLRRRSAHPPADPFEVLAAAELAAAFAEQHDHVAGAAEQARQHAVGVLEQAGLVTKA